MKYFILTALAITAQSGACLASNGPFLPEIYAAIRDGSGPALSQKYLEHKVCESAAARRSKNVFWGDDMSDPEASIPIEKMINGISNRTRVPPNLLIAFVQEARVSNRQQALCLAEVVSRELELVALYGRDFAEAMCDADPSRQTCKVVIEAAYTLADQRAALAAKRAEEAEAMDQKTESSGWSFSSIFGGGRSGGGSDGSECGTSWGTHGSYEDC